MVHNRSSPDTATSWRSDDRFSCGTSFSQCAESGRFRRLRSVDENTCSTNSLAVFCCPKTVAHHPAICSDCRFPVARRLSSTQSSLVLSRLDYCNSVLIDLPATLTNRLQSVQNAAARLVYGLRRYDHVTGALASFHWLRVAEGIQFKIAVLTYRALHDSAPRYLSDFVRVADVPGRQRLRSASTNSVIVPPSRLSTIGDRRFPIAGAEIWNSLPSDVTSAPSLLTFRRRLKAFLFQQSFPNFSI